MRPTLPLALAATLLALPALAQAPLSQGPVPRIVVSGQGEAAVAPDMAVLTLAVQTEAETARAALDENNDAMADVIEALKEAGIEDRDLQTSGLSISPRYVYPRPGNEEQAPRLVGYQVSNSLTVRVREIDMAGEILDRSVTLGVNQGGTISFTNDDPTAALEEARKRAVEDAVARARTLAQAAGVELGRVLEITENGHMRPPMPFAAMASRMEADTAASVPIQTGENSYTVNINVTFELSQ